MNGKKIDSGAARSLGFGVASVAMVLALAVLTAGRTRTARIATPSPTTRTTTGMSGNTVGIQAIVKRVADTWAAHNEVMLGAGDGMVAATTNMQSIPWFKKIYPRISTMQTVPMSEDMNLEGLLKAEPDVVILSSSYNATCEKLAQDGIPVVYVQFTAFDQLRQAFLQAGTILGESELQRAKRYDAYLDSKTALLNATTSTIPADQKVRVLHLASLSPMKADGNNTLVDTWITTAGGVNAAGNELSGNLQAVSMEQVLKWNPDVIIVGGAMRDRDAVMNDTNWQQVEAVREGRVYVNPKGVFSWDCYGAEEALQIQRAARTLYPDRFRSVDMRNETKSFCETYFGQALTDEYVNGILYAEA